MVENKRFTGIKQTSIFLHADGVYFWPDLQEYPLEQTRINKIIWDSYYIRRRWEHYMTIYIYIMNVVVLVFHFNYGFLFS